MNELRCPKCGGDRQVPIERHPNYKSFDMSSPDMAGVTTFYTEDCAYHAPAPGQPIPYTVRMERPHVDSQELFDVIHGVMDSLDFEAQGRVDRCAELAHRLAEEFSGRRIA